VNGQRGQDPIARQSSAMAQYSRALGMYQNRIRKIGAKGQRIVGTVYDPVQKRGLRLVGGARNRSAKVPAQTLAGITAALRSGVRAERTMVELSR
jgi:hypothetical protein